MIPDMLFDTASRAPVCPICNGNRLYYVFSTATGRVARCDDCGLLAAAPARDSTDQSFRQERGRPPDSASETLSTTIGTIWNVETIFQWIRSRRPSSTGNLLVVGLGSEDLVGYAIGCGYKVTVVEPSAEARLRLHHASHGHSLTLVSNVMDASLAKESCDVAVLDGALNTTGDPNSLLRRIHQLLKPEGLILGTAPSVVPESRPVSDNLNGAAIRPGCFAFEDRTMQSILFQHGFRELLSLPPTRPRRPSRASRPCAILATRSAIRSKPLVSVVLPAFNEAGTVAVTLERLIAKEIAGVDIEIIIVESNSTDGTREIVEASARHPRVRLVLEDRPRGKGHAVRTGLAQARGDFIIIQDADTEYDLEDYDVLLEPLLAGREAFILGARHGGQTWKIRKFNDQPGQALLLNLAHGVFTSMINLSLGLRLNDPFTMYKVFRRDCLHSLTFECNRFDFDWELLIKLVRKGYDPLEIPVNYRSRSFKEGKKVSVFRDPITWMVALFRCMTTPIDLSARTGGTPPKSRQ